jgi:NadR type nicotinamide-nucleotide adenylyltransferase
MAKINTSRTTGLIIGKFMPPHQGHKYLVDFARNYVDELTILMCSTTSESISGELRYKWMKEMFPDVKIVHVTDENPQESRDHPDFWNIWKDSIECALPEGADYLFASEDYGSKLADILNMKYIPVDPARQIVPVSGTMIRENPLENWKYIPEEVRSYFVKKVCVVGPESTGKSTLTKQLAKHFDTVYVSEYARTLLDKKDGICEYSDIEFIAIGQMASEDAIARQANKVMFCDTDLITTTIWSEILFGKCPDRIYAEADKRKYDLYLLLDVDVPFVSDKQRYGGTERQLTVEHCKKELESRGRKYIVINGSWKERFDKYVGEIEKVLGGVNYENKKCVALDKENCA